MNLIWVKNNRGLRGQIPIFYHFPELDHHYVCINSKLAYEIVENFLLNRSKVIYDIYKHYHVKKKPNEYNIWGTKYSYNSWKLIGNSATLEEAKQLVQNEYNKYLFNNIK